VKLQTRIAPFHHIKNVIILTLHSVDHQYKTVFSHA
jgi:hypothetical protein